MPNEYKLEVYNGHMLVEIDGNTYLMDTGSPTTMSTRDTLQLAGRVYDNLSNNFMGISVQSVGDFLGRGIDGLIGADILSEYAVTFDLVQNIIIFDKETRNFSENSVSFDLIMGIPLIDTVIRNIAANLFIDTGAQLSYINDEFTGSELSLGTFQDFHPSIGRFSTETYKIPVRISGLEIETIWGNLPEQLSLILNLSGADGIIGFALFKGRVVTIDYINCRMNF